MRYALVLLSILGAAPAMAADAGAAPVAHTGAMLRDANKVRLSTVDSVNKDGSVGIIFDGRYVTVPASSLTLSDGKLMTSLTKAQVTTLN